jgi:SAM-dependent methyltransferase
MDSVSYQGRFATTAAFYARYRPPYPAGFFATVADRVGLRPDHRLIDLGTGPGLLALGFAPHVGSVVGVDPEPAMLAAAKAAAERAGRALTLIENTAEALPEALGRFDAVTIGRALHWMAPAATAALLGRLLAPGGVLLICSARSAADGRNPWLAAYDAARADWSGAAPGQRYRPDLAALAHDARLRIEPSIDVEASHAVTPGELAWRVLTFSTSSPAVLGDRLETMRRDVEQRMLPFSSAGVLPEVVLARAQVARAER